MGKSAWFDLPREKGPFFTVLWTTERTQTAVMTVAPGEEAGPPEVHGHADQVFHILEGRAEVKVWEEGGETDAPAVHREAGPGTVLVVPAGTRHWVKSVGDAPLYFLTVYGPPAY